MNKEKEEMLEKLREVKQTAEEDLIKNSNTENKSEVLQDVKYYGNIELTRKDNGEKDSFELYTVEIYDYNKDEIKTKIYLDGHEVDLLELMQEYEEDITDTLSNKLNEKKQEDLNKDKEISDEGKKEKEKIYSLNELEEEKEQEQEEKGETKNADKKKDEKEESKNDLTGKKPKYVIQTIDIDKAYVDNWTTVRKGFNLPSGVEKIAIANPMQKDDNILSSNMTMYMLDNRGNILENVNGKTIKDFFEIDDATGNNPMYDDNTKLELEKYAEKNKGQTMRRFQSKQNPDLYLSAEQKKIGQYVEVYAGSRTRDGNDPLEVQLETDNVEIQTSFEMQKIVSGYKGIYNKENIDKEADIHEAHGDDEMNIPIENADGNELTREMCDNPFVPDTNITWEQFSKSVGDKDINELMKEFFEQYNGNNGQELILKIQSDYKEQKDIEQTSENEKEEDLGRFREGPWDKQ